MGRPWRQRTTRPEDASMARRFIVGEVGSFPPMPDNDRCVCGVRRSGVIGNQNQRAQYDRRSTMPVATLLLLLSMTATCGLTTGMPANTHAKA